MEVTYEYKGEKGKKEVEKDITVQEFLNQLNIASNTVIVVAAGTLLLAEEEVREEMKILSAVSGG